MNKLDVDITFFFVQLFQMFLDFMKEWYHFNDSVILINGDLIGLDFDLSLLDFSIGILVTSIVLGAFLKISKADEFYGGRR